MYALKIAAKDLETLSWMTQAFLFWLERFGRTLRQKFSFFRNVLHGMIAMQCRQTRISVADPYTDTSGRNVRFQIAQFQSFPVHNGFKVSTFLTGVLFVEIVSFRIPMAPAKPRSP